MVSVDTFVPKGFVEGGRHPRVTAALGRRLEVVGRKAPPQRVHVVLASLDRETAAQALFAENPSWQARKKAPGIFEVQLDLAALDAVLANTATFALVDVATRLHGERVLEPKAQASLRISATDAARAKSDVLSAGGRIAGQAAEASLLATVPASALGTLLRSEAIETIEVVGIA